ncbi:uncharacterized protein N0V89_011017 [Didymosphaeria variabile]|uniref:Uncharacterized protein n=1 Tax=Didymosphaeria variabile TaxID=1932322 RepID=A0A9W8XCC1_9PLEO|nr:uncharacterized protein N0V89_011017 [Didymosphaeria variabile]KAJ4347081.1 hypothetical protein N0V89_011017 [Didymosphaeria variabile]
MATRTTLLFSLLAATACANITTSYFLPNTSYGTNRLRFVGSVINASDDRVTLAVALEDDPDYTNNFDMRTATYTFGSTMFDYSTADFINRGYSESSGGNAYSLKCDFPSTASTADCTVSRGPELLKGACRWTNNSEYSEALRSERPHTQLYTFSDTDTAGVETIVRTLARPNSKTPIPGWCSSETDRSKISVPSSALAETYQPAKSSFNQYQFVITAGEEKLPSATTGGAVSTDGSTPTGTEDSGTGSPGAAPMKTVAPALAGLGAAVAMFLRA